MTTLELKTNAFLKAFIQLEKALNEPETEYTRDASIQRFEFTYELAWKALKSYLATLDIITLSPTVTGVNYNSPLTTTIIPHCRIA